MSGIKVLLGAATVTVLLMLARPHLHSTNHGRRLSRPRLRGATMIAVTLFAMLPGGGRSARMGQGASPGMVGRLRRRTPMASRLVVVGFEPAWVREHHPEWWGDYYQGKWYPAAWWYQYQPEWAREHHPEWWGDDDEGVWYPAGWWWHRRRDWVLQNHPEWWGDDWDGEWYPASWWW